MTVALTLLDGVRWNGAVVPGDRAQALLAALALGAPRAVPVADLVAAVWDDGEPDHPEKALQVQVSRLRSRTSPEVVAHVGSGYRLGLRDDEVDALHLRRLVATAREARAAGDLDVARHAAGDALAVPVGSREEGVLGDLVARAERDRADAGVLLGGVLLARGDHAGALPLLEGAVAAAPDDEALLADLLQAESVVRGVPAALARFAAYDARVRDDLGAEPGERLHRVHAELLARDAPVRSGLKYDAAPMVGRDADVAAIRGLLSRSRVVSVVGAGGLGKTRMAHLVGRLATQPVVHFVELAGVTTSEGVLTEVAGALGVGDAVGTTSVRTAQLRSDLRQRIAEQLSGPPTLLILDNCEHLLDAAADLVAFLVSTVDGLSVLTTTRAPLGIAAEQVYLLPQLGRDDAVELFLQRARAARSDARLDRDEVAALTDRLDGLPLAIELAAAKVRVMAVAEIAERLADRFALLAGGDRSAPDRHRTLEAVIAWSWNLLRGEDQQALALLAAFPDGFSLAGASAVLDRDALASVSELVEQSLLVVREGERGLRYRFLETVREYGAQQRAARDDAGAADERLLAWGVGLARVELARLYSPEQVDAMDRLRAEAGNLAALMRRSLEGRDARASLYLVGALTSLWTIEGEHPSVAEVSGVALDVLCEGPLPAPDDVAEYRGVLTSIVVNAAIFSGEVPEPAIDRLKQVGLAGDGSRSDALVRVLLATWAHGDLRTAPLGTLDELCADPDPFVARLALQWSSQTLENAGELEQALDTGQRALALCDDSDGPWTRALLNSQLCGLWTQRGDWARAQETARLALATMERLGATQDVAQLRSIVALADLALGRVDAAAPVLDDLAATVSRDANIGWSLAGAIGQGELALARGETDRGLALYRDAVVQAQQRRIDQADLPIELMPWVLYAEAGAMFAHLWHGRRDDAADIAASFRAKLPALLDGSMPFLDYPAFGGVLVALGTWELTGETTPSRRAAAVRSVALGHRFGYHRSVPSLAWEHVRALVDPADHDHDLDRHLSADLAHSSFDLKPVAAEAVGVLTG